MTYTCLVTAVGSISWSHSELLLFSILQDTMLDNTGYCINLWWYMILDYIHLQSSWHFFLWCPCAFTWLLGFGKVGSWVGEKNQLQSWPGRVVVNGSYCTRRWHMESVGFWSGPALPVISSNGLREVTQGTLRFAVTADWGPSGCAGELGLQEPH